MVTDRYQHVRHHPDVPALAAYLREQGGVPLWGIDNLPGSQPLESAALPARCACCSGRRARGSRRRRGARSTCTFSIAQYGSTRSINASAAAAIAMHAWVRAHAGPPPA